MGRDRDPDAPDDGGLTERVIPTTDGSALTTFQWVVVVTGAR